MNREQIIRLVSQLLQENLGNRLTTSLATGIATLLNQELLNAEVPENTA